MPLTPTDMLSIQSAIDAYEKKYPDKPSPSAAEALAWRAGKRAKLTQPNSTVAVRLSAVSLRTSLKLMVRWLGGGTFFKRRAI